MSAHLAFISFEAGLTRGIQGVVGGNENLGGIPGIMKTRGYFRGLPECLCDLHVAVNAYSFFILLLRA